MHINIKKILGSYIHRIRVLSKGFFHKAHVSVSGRIYMGKNASIDIGDSCTCSIGRNFQLLQNSYIGVRKNATLKIGKSVFINRNCTIVCHESITINDGTTIGPNVCIYDHDHDIENRGSFKTSAVLIKQNCWIGANVVILKGVTIGKNSIVAAGSIVTKDIPDNSLLIQKKEEIVRKLD